MTNAATETKARFVENPDRTSLFWKFDHKDRFGRQIGAMVTIFSAFVHEYTGEGWYSADLGTYRIGQRIFAFEPSATRNGGGYGASQRTQYFRTEAERDAAVVKYVKAAEKRAAKIR